MYIRQRTTRSSSELLVRFRDRRRCIEEEKDPSPPCLLIRTQSLRFRSQDSSAKAKWNDQQRGAEKKGDSCKWANTSSNLNFIVKRGSGTVSLLRTSRKLLGPAMRSAKRTPQRLPRRWSYRIWKHWWTRMASTKNRWSTKPATQVELLTCAWASTR